MCGESMSIALTLKNIAQALVDFPESISIEEHSVSGNNSVYYVLWAEEKDVGKIVGKKGSTILAIRTILSAVSGKSRKLHTLDVRGLSQKGESNGEVVTHTY